MKGVFVHRLNSSYKDEKGLRYHFPRKRYLSRVQQMLDDFCIIYEEIRGLRGRFYTGIGRISDIIDDIDDSNQCYAVISDFLDFDRNVPYLENGGYEKSLVMQDLSINGGMVRNAVRIITDTEFLSIVSAGLSETPEWPDRDEDNAVEDRPQPVQWGFSDYGTAQPAIIGDEFSRPTVTQLNSRKWRDRKFRYHVKRAYDRTCAFTGLRLINGRGRPEVEAAHIVPVEHGGNDWIRNGIALSGTVHWMFDRGLISLSDDFEILSSRKLNSDISNIIVPGRRAIVPQNPELSPHPDYLAWHRRHHGFLS